MGCRLSPQILPTNRVRLLPSGAFPVAGGYLRWRVRQSSTCRPANAPARNCGHLFRSDELIQLAFAKNFLPEFWRALSAITLLDRARLVAQFRRHGSL